MRSNVTLGKISWDTYLKSTCTNNKCHVVKNKNLKSSLIYVIPAAICRKRHYSCAGDSETERQTPQALHDTAELLHVRTLPSPDWQPASFLMLNTAQGATESFPLFQRTRSPRDFQFLLPAMNAQEVPVASWRQQPGVLALSSVAGFPTETQHFWSLLCFIPCMRHAQGESHFMFTFLLL